MERFKHILIFETEASGHQPDYIRLLISHFPEQNLALKLTFLVSSNLFERLRVTEEITKRIEHGEIEFITLTEHENVKCTHRILWIRSIHRWFTALNYCRRCKADHIHFLFVDHMQFPLAIRLPLPEGITVSGTLFRPSIHYSRLWNITLGLKEKMSNVRKQIFYRLMLTHPGVGTIFSLDEYFASYARKSIPYGHKVHYLPDPSILPADDEQCTFPCSLAHLVPPGKKIFLLFGALDRRKGIFQALKALSMLDDRVAKHTAFIFAGELRDEVRQEFITEFQNYLKSHPGRKVHLEDRFLSDGELVYLLKRCDVVLIPYQRHVGSSGLLIWAASACKPVITQDFGLIGTLTRAYKLGQAVDTTKPSEIAKAIKRFVDRTKMEGITDTEKMAMFVSGRSPKEFSRKFYEGMLRLPD